MTALEAAAAAKKKAAAMPGFERAALLRKVGQLLVERTDEIAAVMTSETGKAIKDAKAEVTRSLDTIMLSAEEAIRIEGEQVPLDGSQMGAGKFAFMLRFPVGVVAGITPFNAPFNLACHKIGPALAAGNTIVLKAPPQAPGVVTKLVELFVDAGTPAGFVNLLHGNAVGPALVRDPRVDFITFTGSSRVGFEIKAASGARRCALELGGNGVTIVHADADLADAAPTCARNAMRLAGQSCISVQNVYVHDSIYDRFVVQLVEHVKQARLGDPADPATDVGTLIDEAAAKRVEQWVTDAASGGARILTGGRRHGAQYEPTVLVDVAPEMKVVCEEVFGPVVTVQRYGELAPLLENISADQYGLQCGIYTKSLPTAFQAIRGLRVGGVIVNGSSTWRTDQLAYGGVKASGHRPRGASLCDPRHDRGAPGRVQPLDLRTPPSPRRARARRHPPDHLATMPTKSKTAPRRRAEAKRSESVRAAPAGAPAQTMAMPAGAQPKERGGIQSLERAFAILEHVAANRHGISLAELCKSVGLHSSTTFHLIKTMVQLNYASQDSGSKKYKIGRKVFALAAGALDENELATRVMPVLEHLTDRSGESSHFAIRSGEDVIILARISGSGMFQMVDRAGAVRPANATALGKVLLAAITPTQVERYLDRGELPRFTPRTIVEREALLAELDQVRRDGIAFDDAEFDAEARCVAVPVHDFLGRVAGAIGISGPLWRLSLQSLHEKSKMVRQAAAEFSAELGYRGEARTSET